MRKYALLIVILLLVVVSLVALAQDDGDNECLDGGLMARADGNGCTSDWAWTCGWYLDNWLDNGGWLNDDNFFPDWCAPESLLPPRPEASASSVAISGGGDISAATCIYNGQILGADAWIDFSAAPYIAPLTFYYADAACSVQAVSQTAVYRVHAPAGLAAAQALCTSVDPGTTATGPDGDNVYRCL